MRLFGSRVAVQLSYGFFHALEYDIRASDVKSPRLVCFKVEFLLENDLQPGIAACQDATTPRLLLKGVKMCDQNLCSFPKDKSSSESEIEG